MKEAFSFERCAGKVMFLSTMVFGLKCPFDTGCQLNAGSLNTGLTVSYISLEQREKRFVKINTKIPPSCYLTASRD